MKTATFDAIVVGSGATGGFAAKELSERGLNVLVLEAGGPLPEAKFELAAKAQFAAIGSWKRIKAGMTGQHKQALTSFYSSEKAFLFVNDNEHPYESKQDFYLWLRGKQVGGRFLAWGRVGLRMSDNTFMFRSHEGTGFDWPIGYADIAPYYEEVERFLGVVGNDDGIAYCPAGSYVRPAGLSKAEQKFKAAVEGEFSDAKVMAWRYVRKEATPVDAQRCGIESIYQTLALADNLDAVANLFLGRELLTRRIARDVPSLLLLFFMTNTLGVAPAVAGVAIFGAVSLKIDWLRKHRTKVPAAVVVLLRREEIYGDPSQWLQVCNNLDTIK